MINPISFLWRQFNGPQITAICHAIWQYFKDTYDSTLEYLYRIDIATANTQHLTVLGSLAGLSRPLIPVPDDETLVFTETYQFKQGYGVEPETWTDDHMIPVDMFPADNGFSSLNNRNLGGIFSEVHPKSGYSYIADYLYRAFVRGNARSTGSLGSLIALDDMLYEAWKADHSANVPVYRFRWANKLDNPNYTPADIFVDLGVTGDWSNPYMTYAEVKLLGKTVYYPIPKLVPILIEGDSQLDPEGLVRILIMATEDVYGLDTMWEHTGTPSDTIDDGITSSWDLNPLSVAEVTSIWNGGSAPLDGPDPSPEFTALTTAQIEDMWN